MGTNSENIKNGFVNEHENNIFQVKSEKNDIKIVNDSIPINLNITRHDYYQKLQASSKLLSSTSNDVIVINGNQNFTETANERNWVGSGTISNPFLITHLTISLLYINNTNLFFIFNNISFQFFADFEEPQEQLFGSIPSFNIVHNIFLSSVSNGKILNSGNLHRVTLINSHDNYFENNKGNLTTDSYYDLINSTNNKFVNNSMGFGFFLNEYSMHNDLISNFVNNGAIHLEGDYNSAVNNIINGYDYIFWWSPKLGIFGSNNEVINNSVSGHGQVIGFNGFYNLIAGNKIYIELNNGFGIYGEGWYRFENNKNIPTFSKHNVITKNEIFGENIDQIGIELGSNIAVENITVSHNILHNLITGINFPNVINSSVFNNILMNNTSGLRILRGNYNSISNNTFIDNIKYGIELNSQSISSITFNKFSNNQIINTIDGCGLSLNDNVFDNIFLNNSFIDNFPSQVCVSTSSIGNVFAFNYWNDWKEPDIDKNDIVDIPYTINANIKDLFPLVFQPAEISHYLMGLRVIYPNGGENLIGTIKILWSIPLDTFSHSFLYDIFLFDGTNWFMLAFNLTNNQYVWNSTSTNFPNGVNYLIKVVVKCTEGFSISDESDSTFRLVNKQNLPSKTSTASGLSFNFFNLILFFLISFLIIRKKHMNN